MAKSNKQKNAKSKASKSVKSKPTKTVKQVVSKPAQKLAIKSKSSSKSEENLVPRAVPLHECPVCGSSNVFYKKERAELICRDCGEIHAQII